MNALKKRDYKMVEIVLKGLKRKKNYYSVCDDVYNECIKIDHIECAQSVVEQSWHTQTQEDYDLTERYYGGMHFWLLQRSSGSMFNLAPCNDENDSLIFYDMSD